MNLIVPILFLVLAMISASNKKKAREARQQAQRRTAAALDEMDGTPRRGYTPIAEQRRHVQRPPQHRQPIAAAMDAAPAPSVKTSGAYVPVTHTVQTQGSMEYYSSEGEVSGDSAEGSSAYNDTEAIRASIENGSSHVVRDSFDSDHTHVESSATGFEECPPERPQDENYKLPVERVFSMPKIAFGPEDVRRAIVYSEIFNKPRARRR